MAVPGVFSIRRLAPLVVAWGLVCSACPLLQAAEDDTQLLIDRMPFDRITLNAENEGAVLDVVLLELADRRVPNPLPTSGKLEVRQLSNPSVLYQVDWSAIEKVQLYEELILEDALRLTSAGKSADAFRTLQFLHQHYPKLPGLNDASEQYVKREALDAFSAKRYDESLATMLSLYDINPDHRGLAEAVQTVSDRVITTYLSERDYAAARSVLELLKEGFPTLNLQNVSSWEDRFRQEATEELAAGRQAFREQRYDAARQAVRRAQDILPSLSDATELMREIDRASPQLVVGVHQLVTTPVATNALEWSRSRVRRLVDPQLVEMVDFGAEGGIYRSPWVSLNSDDAGLRLDLTLETAALRQGITPETVSLRMLAHADPRSECYQADFAALFENVAISGGQEVGVLWRWPHVRPEALVRLSLSEVTSAARRSGIYRPQADEDNPNRFKYVLPTEANAASGPQTLVERVYENEEAALVALLQGEVSALDRIPPWQHGQLRADARVAVGNYRLPTVHVLLLNYANPLMGNREFRRALCYGIDREGILRDLVLAKDERPGFETLTGPMPAGLSTADPVGYAYNQQLPSRPYEPRLASVLATVARAALAKKSNPAESTEEADEEAEQVVPPLVLAYPPEPVARVCCQTIGVQLTAIGIPIKLLELSARTSELPAYDLLYAELAIHEPLVDARRLLGPTGLAGLCSPSMTLALERVDQAKNWREARQRLQAVHEVAYYDLPVVPLWQTVDSFAYRKSLEGLGSTPVTLYQNVSDWRVNYEGGTP